MASLKSFADWDKVTKEIIEMQAEWKGIGYASKKMNTLLFNRFRKACDDFFTSKAEYFKKTKEEFRDNLAKKEAFARRQRLLKTATRIVPPTMRWWLSRRNGALSALCAASRATRCGNASVLRWMLSMTRARSFSTADVMRRPRT